MKALIRTLIIVARFIESAAHRLKLAAITRLEADKDKALERAKRVSEARMASWDREVQRHKENLASIQRDVAEAEAARDARIAADEQKIKEIELI